jgi:hypothetical protein
MLRPCVFSSSSKLVHSCVLEILGFETPLKKNSQDQKLSFPDRGRIEFPFRFSKVYFPKASYIFLYLLELLWLNFVSKKILLRNISHFVRKVVCNISIFHSMEQGFIEQGIIWNMVVWN